MINKRGELRKGVENMMTKKRIVELSAITGFILLLVSAILAETELYDDSLSMILFGVAGLYYVGICSYYSIRTLLLWKKGSPEWAREMELTGLAIFVLLFIMGVPLAILWGTQHILSNVFPLGVLLFMLGIIDLIIGFIALRYRAGNAKKYLLINFGLASFLILVGLVPAFVIYVMIFGAFWV
jgi:hypothetical protein